MEICFVHCMYSLMGVCFGLLQLQAAMGKIQSLGGSDSEIKQSALRMTEGNLV